MFAMKYRILLECQNWKCLHAATRFSSKRVFVFSPSQISKHSQHRFTKPSLHPTLNNATPWNHRYCTKLYSDSKLYKYYAPNRLTSASQWYKRHVSLQSPLKEMRHLPQMVSDHVQLNTYVIIVAVWSRLLRSTVVIAVTQTWRLNAPHISEGVIYQSWGLSDSFHC